MRRFICLLVMAFVAVNVAITAKADPPEAAPALRIAYKNLSYSSEIYSVYAVSYEDVDAPQNIKMLFWNDYRNDGYLQGTEDYRVSIKRTEEINGAAHAVFYSRGVAPKNLVDAQYCRAYIQIDGQDYYSEVIKYNPLNYLLDVAEAGTDADRALATALRAYGAAAQTRFAYQTDDLASANHYELALEGAVLEDGFSYGLYKAGTAVQLTAIIPDGDSVVKWVDRTGVQLGTADTLNYTVTGNDTVRVVLASNPDACEHVFSAWIAASAATCSEDGAVAHYHCDKCGRVFDSEYKVIENVVIPALGHDWVDVPAQAATCVPGWTAYRYCTRCETREGYEELDATAEHNYVEQTVAPDGASRGYTNHICNVCGDIQGRSDYDYSLYSGVDFSQAGKFLLPQNFESPVYTIEASIQLSTAITGRGGVVLGNYDNKNAGFNFEIYNGGKPRLFFMTVVGKTTTKYDYVFDTDIRSDDSVKNLAFTIQSGEAKLYIDGVLAETKELADFAIPEPGRSLVLGGDNRAGNSQGFVGTIYSVSIFRDIRTEEELMSDLVLADASDPNCICSYNLVSGNETTGAVVLDSIQENAQVTTVEELAYHASHGTTNIEIMNDIMIDRTIYVVSDVTLFANGNYSLTRDPDFLGDMFVVGENEAGRNLILDGIVCKLSLGKSDATGTLTIDGNKDDVTEDVFGTLVYVNFSGYVNIHDGAVLTNNKKVANSRTLGMEQYYGNMIGGAAIVNINGVVTMDGGTISNNESNFDDPSNGDNTAENHLEACYGGAIFNNSNFVMSGGTINGNTGYYGGAIADFQECNITGGVIENNYTSHAGGAIYVYNALGRMLTIGDPDGENSNSNQVIFRNNYTTGSNGGAIYSGASCTTYIYGGATFVGNHTYGSGGAVYLANVGGIGSNTVFNGNYTGGKGGAVYITGTRATTLDGVAFTNNTANYGGAVALEGTNTTISNCTATGNTSNVNGGAYYFNRLSDGTGSTVTMTNGTISSNVSSGEAGAIFADLNCSVTVTGTSFSENSSVGNGGAISVHGVTKLTLTDATFSENSTGTTTGESPVSGNGGALYASYRTVTDNSDPENPVYTYAESSVEVKDCAFDQNHSNGMGGAVMALAHDADAQVIEVDGSTFTSNTADTHGGALVVSHTIAQLTNNTFTGNTATQNGGATYANSDGVITGSGNTFTNNQSNNTQYGGGAMYFTNSTATLSGTTFTGNEANVNGGALAAYTNSSVTLTNTVATGNSAAGNGGFAMTYNSTLTMDVTGENRNVIGSLTDTALGNTAIGGGAIYADQSSVINVSCADIGYNKTTGSGGALYFTTATGTLADCTIAHNVGGKDGGDSYGGAMMVGYGSNVTVTDSAFSDNTATTWAGAIYVRHKNATDTAAAVPSTVTVTDTSFTGNSSTIGGAIYVREYCTFTANNSTFSSNSSTGDAGAVYVCSNGSFASTATTTFTENTAAGAGGAIYAAGNAAVNLAGTTLSENTSGSTGGAVYLHTGATLTTSGDSAFDQNTSVGIGGALYCNSATASLSDTTFSSNATTGSSAWYGGAIYTNGTSALTVTRCTFTGNNAHTVGARAMRWTGRMSAASSTSWGSRTLRRRTAALPCACSTASRWMRRTRRCWTTSSPPACTARCQTGSITKSPERAALGTYSLAHFCRANRCACCIPF